MSESGQLWGLAFTVQDGSQVHFFWSHYLVPLLMSFEGALTYYVLLGPVLQLCELIKLTLSVQRLSTFNLQDLKIDRQQNLTS